MKIIITEDFVLVKSCEELSKDFIIKELSKDYPEEIINKMKKSKFKTIEDDIVYLFNHYFTF